MGIDRVIDGEEKDNQEILPPEFEGEDTHVLHQIDSESSVNPNETYLLGLVIKLEQINGELNDIFEKWGRKVGDIMRAENEEPGTEQRITDLWSNGLEVYCQILKPAKQIYDSWSRPKQTRVTRQLYNVMDSIEVNSWPILDNWTLIGEIQSGNFDESVGPAHIPRNEGQFIPLVAGVKELIKENNIANDTDPYFERINEAYVIIPISRNGVLPVEFLVADTNSYGYFEYYTALPLNDGSNIRCKNMQQNIADGVVFDWVKDLMGKKVIFFPISTDAEILSYKTAQKKQLEMVFEFDVFENGVDSNNPVGHIVAKEYGALTSIGANEIIAFIKDKTLPQYIL